MTAPADIARPTAADLVRRDYSVAERLAASDDPELRQFGERALATIRGERGLVRTFLPMESERSAATIINDAECDRQIVAFADRHFPGEKMAPAGRIIEQRLRRYRLSADWKADRRQEDCPEKWIGKPHEFCFSILKLNGGAVPSARTIRRILAGHKCG